MSAHALTERAMVVNLSVSVWQGHRLDREATRKVTTEAGAAADAARVNKHLIQKADLAPIVTAQGAIRTHFYEKTLPWRDNGDRLLTRKLYLDFIPEHERLVGEFNTAVDKFLTDRYPGAVAQAEFRMGELFNSDDYPSASVLRRKFAVNLETDAVATAGDFRVQIDQEHVDKVRGDMEVAIEKRIHKAMSDVYKRIADTVGYFAERMANPEAVFRDSTIENVNDLIALLPGLNVLDDPSIEELRLMIDAKLSGLDVKEIRKDPAHRAALAGEAQEIMDRMSGFMQAFGAGES